MSSPQKKLLLIGWDSADWKIIHPLLDAGKMPALAHLLERGIAGNITTLEPQLSPMLWTSIATGKHAYHHGVPGFTEVNSTGQVVPVSAATRKCKALWDMLAEHGLKSHVISWFATQGERPNGCLVSNLYNSWKHTAEQDAADWPPPPPGTYWPESLAAELNHLRVSPYDIDPDEILRLFIPDAHLIDQEKDQRLWHLSQRLSEAFSVHSATCHLLENHQDWNLTAVYYRAIDEICHQFMHYHPPQMAGIKDEDFQMYQHVVEAAYRLHDLFLTRLINLAGPDTAIMLVSDHGFHSDHLRPTYTPRVPAGITVWHRPQGILVASGPGFKKDQNHYGARLLDVAPTILTYFGLPVGADMEGRILTDLFENPPAISSIPSWENTAHPRTHLTVLNGDDQKALLDQFVELGYIDPVSADSTQASIETNRENDWNIARALMDGGRYEAALPLLESVLQLHPERNDYAQMLAICQMRIGLFDEAQQTVQACVETLGGNNAQTALLQANIALENKQAAQALEHLAQAQALSPKPTLTYLELLGRTQLALRHWADCVSTCHAALQLDPTHALAYLSLARCHIHLLEPETAAEHALSAISLQYGNPQAHFLLGTALIQLRDWTAAARALETTIKLAPQFGPAYRQLAIAQKALGDHSAAAFSLQQARLLRHYNQAEQNEHLARIRTESSTRAAELAHIIHERRLAAEAARLAAEASGLPADQTFTIVTGLPRSGTSLMMQMLHAGGLEPMTDGTRQADEDNPQGYLEWEEIRQLPKNPLLIEKAHGKATKVITALLPALPPKHRYNILFMTRPVEEVVLSQEKMLARRGSSPRATAEHLRATQDEQVQHWLKLLRTHPRVNLLEIPYPDLVQNPAPWVEKITTHIGADMLPTAAQMIHAVKPELHRNRVSG